MYAHPLLVFRGSLAIGILFSCMTLETASTEISRTVEAGGNRVAVRIFGSSGPSVVFEAGRGEDSDSFVPIARQLSSCATAVLYDRPGTGRSGPRTEPVVPASTVADELDEVLARAFIPPPYILVGHSLGGLYVQAYARSRPRNVAAVVLIDATTPLEPPDTFVSTVLPRAGTTAAAEEAGVPESMAALRGGPPFPPVPLIVIAASEHNDTPEREALWQDVQARTATLSPRGELVRVGGGHFVQTENPEVVVTAILDAAVAAGYDVAGCR
jgi:pimeloyl-ACP methyl ester carboxylesterase